MIYSRAQKVFRRNFVLFCAATVLCVLGLIIFLTFTNDVFEQRQNALSANSALLTETEKFSENLSALLESHVNYSIGKSFEQFEDFQNYSDNVEKNITALSVLVEGDEMQEERVDALQRNFRLLKEQLDAQSNDIQTQNGANVREISLAINQLKSRVLSLHSAILSEENRKLNNSLDEINDQKETYFHILILGSILGGIILIGLNAVLLEAQSKRLKVERKLKHNEERFRLAIEGMNDGVFDWNLQTNKVFYSAQFFQMLGYDRGEISDGTLEDIEGLLHPDDKDRVWEYVNSYLAGELPEYSSTFRMKAANGKWLWIQSRAKAKFDENKQAVRLVGVHTDITYLKEYQEFLKREKKNAEQANIAKSEFLAHMSHEIRTPLTAINGIAEIFEKNIDKFDSKYQRLVKTLKNSTSSLKDLINDILDFSKIEEGEINLEKSVISFGEFMDQIHNITDVQASEKGIGFYLKNEEIKSLAFEGDPVRLRQILINLIGNAIKFTNEGEVVVESKLVEKGSQQFLKIAVKDTGIGIPDDKLDTIFERFKQSDDSISRSYGGTGLGLSISQKLAEMMGGLITVESTYGEGSSFTLILPLEKANALNIKSIQSTGQMPDMFDMPHAKPLQTDAKKNQDPRPQGHEDDNDDDHEEQEGTVTSLTSRPDKPALASASAYKEEDDAPIKGTERQTDDADGSILIVEDYEGNVVVLGYLLEQMNIDYQVAENGLIGVEKYKKGDFDIILMDIQMPQMDGFTATQTIRDYERNQGDKATPIIGMTAHALVGDRQKCLDAGMNAYIPKPINEDDLKAEIRRLLVQGKSASA